MLRVCSIGVSTNEEHWWNDTARVKPKYSERNLSHCHFVHHKAHIYVYSRLAWYRTWASKVRHMNEQHGVGFNFP
jgi:hypothetical protein